jgi:long-chain acyl-CoA synthetase
VTAPNVTDAIFATAARQPHAVAVIDGESVISYRMLCAAVRAAALRLQTAGWRAGDRAGIAVAGRQALHLLISLALARSGVAQISLPADESAAALVANCSRAGIDRVIGDVALPAPVAVLHADAGWLEAAAHDDVRAAGGDFLWAIAETSGTTARPKLTGISHAVEAAHARSQSGVFAHVPGERFMNLTPMRFLTALKRAFCCLADGGTLVLRPPGLPLAQTLDWIDRHDVAYLSCVPVHLQQMLDEWPAGRGLRLPLLRVLRTSSAALPAAVLQAVHVRISPNVYVNYGATEAGPLVAATPALLARFPQSVGLPLPGVELQVVDASDRPCVPGATGQVRVRGEGVQSAYLRAEPAEAARVFRDGWCYPGDLARVNAEGVVFLEGRADEVMNLNGVMINPAEIEAVLAGFPGVGAVAAFALPVADGRELPAAAVVFRGTLSMALLQQYCAQHLGTRAPRVIYQVDAIPRNAAGKVLRRQLAAEALAHLQRGAGGPAAAA